ncbi:acyltransferase [bacterium]|nr:acyltransferase [bacterium]
MSDIAPAVGSGPDAHTRFLERLERRVIPGLDGVRALAVLLVMGHHFGFAWINGSLGVMMFFVLSGFLISRILLREHAGTGGVSLGRFYRRRALRIFPAFYAFWVVMIVVPFVRGHVIDWGAALSSFLYVSNYFLALFHKGESDFGHTWSLSIEEQFYLVWPFVFRRGMSDLARLTRWLVAAIAVVWVYRAVLLLVFHVRVEYLYRAFDTRLDHLAVGCLLAVLLERGVLAGFIGFVCRRAWYPAVTLGLILTLQSLHHQYLYVYVIGYAVEPLLIATFLVQLVCWTSAPGWRAFEHPVARYLGRISYPLYLWQQVVLFSVSRILTPYPIPTVVRFALAVGATVVAATISWNLVEKPFLRLKSRA